VYLSDGYLSQTISIKQSCIKDVVSIGFFYMKPQHGSQHAYQLTWCQILLIHYTVDWLSAGSLFTFDRSPYMTCCIQQWCSRDRNLRDRDLVKISRRDRDFIKNSETETRDFKICAFCRNFSKKFCHHFWPWASAGGAKRAIPPLRLKLSTKIL